jgi:hypothetical protein
MQGFWKVGPPQRRSGRGSRRRAMRVLISRSELSATIRDILLADVLAHLLQFKPHRGHRVAAGPEVFTGAASSGQGVVRLSLFRYVWTAPALAVGAMGRG